jgi:hypothetical protein
MQLNVVKKIWFQKFVQLSLNALNETVVYTGGLMVILLSKRQK